MSHRGDRVCRISSLSRSVAVSIGARIRIVASTCVGSQERRRGDGDGGVARTMAFRVTGRTSLRHGQPALARMGTGELHGEEQHVAVVLWAGAPGKTHMGFDAALQTSDERKPMQFYQLVVVLVFWMIGTSVSLATFLGEKRDNKCGKT